jgi:predicted transcriptional regulator
VAGATKQLVVMADSRNIKPDARRIVDELPDTATWEDLMYEIYVRESIEAGLADVEAGRVVSHDDAISSIRASIRGSS